MTNQTSGQAMVFLTKYKNLRAENKSLTIRIIDYYVEATKAFKARENLIKHDLNQQLSWIKPNNRSTMGQKMFPSIPSISSTCFLHKWIDSQR